MPLNVHRSNFKLYYKEVTLHSFQIHILDLLYSEANNHPPPQICLFLIFSDHSFLFSSFRTGTALASFAPLWHKQQPFSYLSNITPGPSLHFPLRNSTPYSIHTFSSFSFRIFWNKSSSSANLKAFIPHSYYLFNVCEVLHILPSQSVTTHLERPRTHHSGIYRTLTFYPLPPITSLFHLKYAILTRTIEETL